jgi:hypothetical protein
MSFFTELSGSESVSIRARNQNMEYRGKRFTIVQGIGPNSWKWAVYLDEKTVKSGEAKTRASAQTNAIWAIDKVLARQKVKAPPA